MLDDRGDQLTAWVPRVSRRYACLDVSSAFLYVSLAARRQAALGRPPEREALPTPPRHSRSSRHSGADSSESRGAQVSRFIWKQASDCQEILRRKGNDVNSALCLRHRRVNSVVGGDISTESHLFVSHLQRPLCLPLISSRSSKFCTPNRQPTSRQHIRCTDMRGWAEDGIRA